MNHFIRIWWQTNVWNKNSLISRNEKSWNSIFLQLLLTFLWSCQKSGPFKMYMALRTFQKNFMSPIFDINSNAAGYNKGRVLITILRYIVVTLRAQCTQCGNLRIFLLHWFYKKSNVVNQKHRILFQIGVLLIKIFIFCLFLHTHYWW